MFKSSIKKEEDAFHHQIRLKCQEETSEILRLERSFVWC